MSLTAARSRHLTDRPGAGRFAAMRRWLLLLAAPFAVSAAEPAYQDLLHSDLPLWAGGQEGKWPRPFVDGDSFGCATRLEYGDWRYDELRSDLDPMWYRLTNYGVFHCFMMVRSGYQRSALGGLEADFSFLVELGKADGGVELWALQRRGRPGADYLLLARRPVAGAIKAFDVLQRQCPKDWVRDAGNIDILVTRYCAVGSRSDLIELARRMSRLPPLGRLTFVEAAEEGK